MNTHGCIDPTVGTMLHAYELGALSTDDTEVFELHLLTCEHCFAEVQRFHPDADALRYDPDIREDVQQEVGRAPMQEAGGSRLKRLVWPKVPLPFRPAFTFVLILLLLYPAYLGLRPKVEPVVRSVQSVLLVPNRSVGYPKCSVSEGTDVAVSFIYDGAIQDDKYVIEIIHLESGNRHWTGTYTGFDSYGRGEIVLSGDHLSLGLYRLSIADPRISDREGRQEYLFELTP